MSHFSILHISDAHIGNPFWEADLKAVMSPLIRDISTVSSGKPPRLIIFSGDLVYGELPKKDIESQLSEAREWLQNVCGVWGRELGQIPILLVPGNHDVQRSAVDETQTAWLYSQRNSDAIETAIKTNSKLWKRMLERQDLWWSFIKDIPNQHWNYDENLRITSGRLISDNVSVGIVGFNSSWGCVQNNEKGKLWFTQHQFQTGLQCIEDCDVRIAVLHHPFSWFHPEEEGWISSKFECNFHLVLHGHIHNSWYTPQPGHVILSAGACYNRSTKENGYYWVDVNVHNKAFDVSARQYQDKGKGEWVPLYVPGKYSLQGTVNLPFSTSDIQPKSDTVASPSSSGDVVLEVVGSCDVAATLPSLPIRNIDRNNEIKSLLEDFDEKNRLLLLTGPESVGKTIFTCQLARMFTANCISIFLNRAPHWSTQLADVKFDVCNQISWLINGRQIEYEVVSDNAVVNYLHKLRRFSLHNRKPIYVFIDGLNQFSFSDHGRAVGDILNIFQVFINAFYYVIALSPESLPTDYKNLTYRTYRVPRFNKEQTLDYLVDVTTQEQAAEIWELTNGHPAALSSIRRLLQRSPHIPISELPVQVPELLEREWRLVDASNSNQVLLLAALSLFPNRFDVNGLNRVLNVPEPEIRFALQNLPFLEQSANSNLISFTSEAVRAFAAIKTKDLKSSIRNLIIQDLMKNPEASTSLQEIPLYLHEAGRDDELARYLSPNHLELLLQQSQSWSQAIEKVDLALSNAFRKEKLQDYTRFALHKVSLLEMQGATPGKAEISALLSLDKWDEAIAFSEAQITKENQLLLFARITKFAKEKDHLLPTSVIETLKRLIIDVQTIGSTDQKLDIASELIYAYPELAIRIVETLSEKQEDIDSALANVSIRALIERNKDVVIEDTLEDINAKIGDGRAKKFSMASQIILGKSPATAALNRIKGLQNAKDQIYLLRQWTLSHPKAVDALPLIEYAIDLVIKTTDYVPTARVLRELATPLPYVTKNFQVSVLTSRISEQTSVLKDKGFTQDYVGLELTLAHVEAAYAENKYKSRLEALYYYISEIEDLSVRTCCYAMLCAKIREIEPETLASRSTSDFLTDLEDSFNRLLLTNADHYTAARDAILTIHTVSPETSIRFVGLINTEPRRNQLYAELAINELKRESISISTLQTLLSSITYKDLLDNTISGILALIEDRTLKIDIDLARLLLEHTQKIAFPLLHCKSIKSLLVIIDECKLVFDPATMDEIYRDLHSQWETIDDAIEKRESGFEITTALADINPSIAVRYFHSSRQLQNRVSVKDDDYSDTVFYSIFLAIRFYRGLIPRNLASSQDRAALIRQISELSSLSQRIELFCQVAIAHLICDRKSQEASSLVLEQIIPLLDNVAASSTSLYESAFIEAAPVLYLTHSPSTRQRLERLNSYQRDIALNRISSFILEKVYPDDPYTAGNKHDYKLSFLEVSELLELLNLMDNDSWIYWYIKVIVDVCHYARSRKSYSQQQLTDIVIQLKTIVEAKLPNPKFIKHAGYKIAALAQISRLAVQNDDFIKQLIAEANEIENIADRSFVLAMIASTMYSGRTITPKQVFEQALNLIPLITTFEDRIEHYQSLAYLAQDIERSISQLALRKATEFVPSIENWRSRAYARRVIDAAYRLDKHLAEELAKKFDSDPARSNISKVPSEIAKEQSLKKRLSEDNRPFDDLEEEDLKLLAKVSWTVLGDINAGKTQYIKLPKSRELIKAASKMSFQPSYNLWLYIAENFVDQYRNTDQAETYIRQLFEAALINSELTYRIANASKSSDDLSLENKLEEYYSGTSTIMPGSRQKALDEIENWCSEFISDYVIVVDPSLRLEDISIIELIRRLNPTCSIIVLASKAIQHLAEGSSGLEESFKDQWRRITSSLNPGSIEFIFVGATLTGDLPVDNRMLLCNRGGLWISTAFSQLGVGASAILRRMSIEEANMREGELDHFIDVRKSNSSVQPFSVLRFTLY